MAVAGETEAVMALLPMANGLAWRARRQFPWLHAQRDDLQQEAAEALVHAVRGYRPGGRAALRTYAFRVVWNRLLNIAARPWESQVVYVGGREELVSVAELLEDEAPGQEDRLLAAEADRVGLQALGEVAATREGRDAEIWRVHEAVRGLGNVQTGIYVHLARKYGISRQRVRQVVQSMERRRRR